VAMIRLHGPFAIGKFSMTFRGRNISCLFALVVVAGCSSTKISSQPVVSGELPRSNNIFAYDFISTPADLPPDSSMVGQFAEHSTPQTPDEIAAERQLGAEMAAQLVSAIQGMGLPASWATNQTMLSIHDIVLRGYLLSIKNGS